MVMSAGYLLLGVATARAGTLPAWSGPAPVLGPAGGAPLAGGATAGAGTLPVWSGPALIFGLAGLWAGNAVGWILFGLAWVVVGIALRPGNGAQTGAAGALGGGGRG